MLPHSPEGVARHRRPWYRTLIGLVILLGFLNGVWISLGINPGKQLWSMLEQVIERLMPQTGLLSALWVVPSVLLVAQLWRSWVLGGILGLLAILLGFAAGLVIATPLPALVMLSGAIVLGVFAQR